VCGEHARRGMRKRSYIIWRVILGKGEWPTLQKLGQVVACIGNYGCEVMSYQCLE